MLKDLLFILFFLTFLNALAQQEQFHMNTRVVYEMIYLTDSTDKDTKKEEMTELLLNDSLSLFRTFQKIRSDSAYLQTFTNKTVRFSAPQVVPLGEVNNMNYQILKLPDGVTKVYDEYTGQTLNNIDEICFYYERADYMAKWSLLGDTLTIQGYPCQKATIDFGGRHWTAWFTPEIPIDDGPYKFRGLPGLILRVYDQNETWYFNMIGIHKVNTSVRINFKETLQFKQTTKEKLYKDRRYFQQHIIEIKEAAGMDLGIHRKEVKSKLAKYIERDNNWIELYP